MMVIRVKPIADSKPPRRTEIHKYKVLIAENFCSKFGVQCYAKQPN